MLDIILANRCYDFAAIFNIGGWPDELINVMKNGSAIVSSYESYATKIESALDDIYDELSILD